MDARRQMLLDSIENYIISVQELLRIIPLSGNGKVKELREKLLALGDDIIENLGELND